MKKVYRYALIRLRKCIGTAILILAFILPFILWPKAEFKDNIICSLISLVSVSVPGILLINGDRPDDSIGG